LNSRIKQVACKVKNKYFFRPLELSDDPISFEANSKHNDQR